jgi:hypothetical protein
MQQTLTCPKCAAPNAANNQFCMVCGESLQMNCPNCGTTVDPSTRFCQSCGAGLGWGARVREIQYQISRTEGAVTGAVAQTAFEMKSQLDKSEDTMRGMMTQYYQDIQAAQARLDDTAGNINKMLIEEHKLGLARMLNRTGLGIMAGGLAVIGISYALPDVPYLGIIGAIIVGVGFLTQLASNFV